MRKITLLLFALVAICSCKQTIAEPESFMVFERWEAGSHYYRIPAVVTAADGSIVVACDRRWSDMKDLPNRIDVVSKRSTDGGRTWSDVVVIAEAISENCGYGDPALVLDRNTGDLLCIYAGGPGTEASTPENPIHVNVSRSSDNGITWTAPKIVTPMIMPITNDGNYAHFGGFCSSGQAHQMKDGTLAFVLVAKVVTEGFRPLYNYVCISEDGGENWKMLPTPVNTDADEAKIVELEDGSWLVAVRNHKQGNRIYHISKDRGQTWTETAYWEDVIEPACNGDLIRYTLADGKEQKNRLLLSVPYSGNERENVSVLMSYDEGKTWPVRKTIWEGLSGYSSLNVLEDGTIGLFTEVGGWDEGFDMYFTRIPLEWLTDGQDKLN